MATAVGVTPGTTAPWPRGIWWCGRWAVLRKKTLFHSGANCHHARSDRNSLLRCVRRGCIGTPWRRFSLHCRKVLPPFTCMTWDCDERLQIATLTGSFVSLFSKKSVSQFIRRESELVGNCVHFNAEKIKAWCWAFTLVLGDWCTHMLNLMWRMP